MRRDTKYVTIKNQLNTKAVMEEVTGKKPMRHRENKKIAVESASLSGITLIVNGLNFPITGMH